MAPARPGAPFVMLAGSPNSGKSTLFNALTGAGRAVANYPGAQTPQLSQPPRPPLCASQPRGR